MAIQPKRIPIPRWSIRTIWAGHRALVSATGGRRGLRTPTPERYGTLRLFTTGRKTGEPRTAILAYLEDGPDLVLMPMNGWAEPEPAWFINLQAHPDANAELPGGTRSVRARLASSDDRARLWPAWDVAWKGELDAWAANRSRPTQLVILEPGPAGG